MNPQMIEKEVVAALTGAIATVACRTLHCPCCDHPLQHAIRSALATHDNAVPPLTVATVFANLRADLEMWEEDQ